MTHGVSNCMECRNTVGDFGGTRMGTRMGTRLGPQKGTRTVPQPGSTGFDKDDPVRGHSESSAGGQAAGGLSCTAGDFAAHSLTRKDGEV
jgi:hypothetical protein